MGNIFSILLCETEVIEVSIVKRVHEHCQCNVLMLLNITLNIIFT